MVTELHWRWKVWQQIFPTDSNWPGDIEQRAKLLDSSASDLFNLFREVLILDILLSICRFLDPESSGATSKKTNVQTNSDKRNLSLKALSTERQHLLGQETTSHVLALLETMKKQAESMETWRNKIIAHNGLHLSMNRSQLPPIPYEDITKAVDQIIEIMIALDDPVNPSNFEYTDLRAQGDGESLVRCLRESAEYRRLCLLLPANPLSKFATDLFEKSIAEYKGQNPP